VTVAAVTVTAVAVTAMTVTAVAVTAMTVTAMTVTAMTTVTAIATVATVATVAAVTTITVVTAVGAATRTAAKAAEAATVAIALMTRARVGCVTGRLARRGRTSRRRQSTKLLEIGNAFTVLDRSLEFVSGHRRAERHRTRRRRPHVVLGRFAGSREGGNRQCQKARTHQGRALPGKASKFLAL
jgi:hypothetical protein